jgi:hypothetical protein
MSTSLLPPASLVLCGRAPALARTARTPRRRLGIDGHAAHTEMKGGSSRWVGLFAHGQTTNLPTSRVRQGTMWVCSGLVWLFLTACNLHVFLVIVIGGMHHHHRRRRLSTAAHHHFLPVHIPFLSNDTGTDSLTPTSCRGPSHHGAQTCSDMWHKLNSTEIDRTPGR